MRYFRIFLLYSQYLLAHPGKSIVWTLTAFLDALIFLAFLSGVFQQQTHILDWTLSSVTAYYFILIAVSVGLLSKIDISILTQDIEKGEIDGRLLKPISYYWQKFYYEVPYRIFQGLLGIIIGTSMAYVLKIHLPLVHDSVLLLQTVLIIILAYFLSFTFKMIIGIISFVTTDIRGLNELVTMIVLLFSGMILPLNLLPVWMQNIAYSLPFAYIVYYPIMAILGQISQNQLLSVIMMQAVWIIGLGLIYKQLWKYVLKHFVSAGK